MDIANQDVGLYSCVVHGGCYSSTWQDFNKQCYGTDVCVEVLKEVAVLLPTALEKTIELNDDCETEYNIFLPLLLDSCGQRGYRRFRVCARWNVKRSRL